MPSRESGDKQIVTKFNRSLHPTLYFDVRYSNIVMGQRLRGDDDQFNTTQGLGDVSGY